MILLISVGAVVLTLLLSSSSFTSVIANTYDGEPSDEGAEAWEGCAKADGEGGEATRPD